VNDMAIEEIAKLREMNACAEALEYLEGFETIQDAWDNCGRGDWMLWLCGRKSGAPWSEGRRKLVRTSCRCARLVYDLMPEESKKALVLFERWSDGEEISREELDAVRYAAADAAASHASHAAAAAAVAVAYAAAAVYAVAYAAAAYAAADAAASHASHAAADAAADAAALKKCADVVREDYPVAPKL